MLIKINSNNSMKKNEEKNKVTEGFSMSLITHCLDRQQQKCTEKQKSMPNNVVGGQIPNDEDDQLDQLIV